ncbi:MAG: hypothetical protein KID02_03930 [Clostridiales bacterium]|nr:hypothetical protein [Clostridiales bacterium]
MLKNTKIKANKYEKKRREIREGLIDYITLVNAILTAYTKQLDTHFKKMFSEKPITHVVFNGEYRELHKGSSFESIDIWVKIHISGVVKIMGTVEGEYSLVPPHLKNINLGMEFLEIDVTEYLDINFEDKELDDVFNRISTMNNTLKWYLKELKNSRSYIETLENSSIIQKENNILLEVKKGA